MHQQVISNSFIQINEMEQNKKMGSLIHNMDVDLELHNGM